MGAYKQGTPAQRRRRWNSIAAIACAGCLSVSAATVVVPGSDSTTEGALLNRYPFATSATFLDDSIRYQQVFAGSAFGATGPVIISQISFRPDASTASAFALTNSSIRIDLSTSSVAPDALSTTFATNTGANAATVYNGSLALSSSDTGPVAGPKAFDLAINLTTPFLYDPSTGNLLLDVRSAAPSSSTGTINFDADPTFGDATSRVFSLDSTSPTADVTDSVGLVTQFGFTPVNTGTTTPLPPGAWAAVPALFAAAGTARRLRSQRGR